MPSPSTQHKALEPAAKEIQICMSSYPTTNPFWFGKITDRTDKQIADIKFGLPETDPYTGEIRELMMRPGLWEHCNVTFNITTSAELVAVLNAVQEKQRIQVRQLLDECKMFYPELVCRDAAEQLVEDNSGYEALTKVLAEVPPSTAWSTVKSVGYDDGTGFAWRAPSLTMHWSMQIGYAIMLEALKRQAGNALPPKTAEEDDEEDDEENDDENDDEDTFREQKPVWCFAQNRWVFPSHAHVVVSGAI